MAAKAVTTKSAPGSLDIKSFPEREVKETKIAQSVLAKVSSSPAVPLVGAESAGYDFVTKIEEAFDHIEKKQFQIAKKLFLEIFEKANQIPFSHNTLIVECLTGLALCCDFPDRMNYTMLAMKEVDRLWADKDSWDLSKVTHICSLLRFCLQDLRDLIPLDEVDVHCKLEKYLQECNPKLSLPLLDLCRDLIWHGYFLTRSKKKEEAEQAFLKALEITNANTELDISFARMRCHLLLGTSCLTGSKKKLKFLQIYGIITDLYDRRDALCVHMPKEEVFETLFHFLDQLSCYLFDDDIAKDIDEKKQACSKVCQEYQMQRQSQDKLKTEKFVLRPTLPSYDLTSKRSKQVKRSSEGSYKLSRFFTLH